MSRRPPPRPPREGATRTGRAVVLLAVAILVAVVLLRHVGSTSPTTAASSSPTTTHAAAPTTVAPTTTTTTTPAIPPAQIKLLVLNGTLSGNLAGETAKRLAANPGYNTLAPDDTTTKVTSSAIYAASSKYTSAGDALAATLGLPASVVQTPIPANAPIRASERTGPDLVLVIGPDLAAKAAG